MEPLSNHVESAIRSVPILALNPSDPAYFLRDQHNCLFTRLRVESPIHFCSKSAYGEFWSVTKYKHVVEIENSPSLFSSQMGFTLVDVAPGPQPRSFMRMDPPEHQQTRRYFASLTSRDKLLGLKHVIRAVVDSVLDSIPLDYPIDWVGSVAAVISRNVFTHVMGLPLSDAEMLEGWAMAAMAIALATDVDTHDYRNALGSCADYFTERCRQQVDADSFNLLSMLIHANQANGRSHEDLMADLMILLIGGMETVRHAMTGSVLLFDACPPQLAQLRQNPSLLMSAMSEVLRLQAPFAYMRRTATEDVDFHGVRFQKGQKIALWYSAANRDEEHFTNPNDFRIDRDNSATHLSFGTGPHHCVGRYLALLELEVLWQLLITRGLVVKPIAPARKINSSFVNGYASLDVRISHSS